MNGDIDSGIPRTRRIKVIDINPHLMCVLCGGYYVDATTIIECLHSFCKSCIVRYLDTSKFCPICDVQVHKTKPLLNIRSDQTLQDIVYKLVPGLFQREMRRRREFYAKQPAETLKNSLPRSNEERGEVDYSSFPHNIFSPDEFISIALEYSAMGGTATNGHDTNEKSSKSVCRRYLRCPVVITVAHIKKLIRAKYGLSSEQRVDLMFSRDSLNDEFMIMDIAYMYAWKRKGPLKLYYRIFDQPNKRLKTFHAHPVSVADDVVKTETAKAEPSHEKKNVGPPCTEKASEKEHDNKKSSSTSPPTRERPSVDEAKSELSKESAAVISEETPTNSVRKDKELKKISVNDSRIEETVKALNKDGQEPKKESEQTTDAAKKIDAVVVVSAECKISLESTDDVHQSACEIKTNGDFKLEKPLREKVNGITTNGKDNVNIREIAST